MKYMKNWGTKRNIIATSALGLAIIFVMANPLVFGYCHGVSTWGDGTQYCYSSITDKIPDALMLSMGSIMILLLLLTLATYRMHDDVFRAWWNFARWMVPIIMFASIAIQFVPSNGGFFNMDGLIYLFVLAPLYAALIFGSLWKIVQKYHELKKVS